MHFPAITPPLFGPHSENEKPVSVFRISHYGLPLPSVSPSHGTEAIGANMPTVKEAMSELGRIGGSVKSARKAEASRRNGKLGGGRKKQPPAIPVERAPVELLIAKGQGGQ